MVKIIRSRLLLLGSLMLLISVNTQAAQLICNTVAECHGLRTQADARIRELQARRQVPIFLEIARDAFGKVKYMKQSEANEYCSTQGAHLPSIRELAQLSMSLGSKGIVDACGSNLDCYGVNAINNADGSDDIFNFSASGYQRPEWYMGKRSRLWSSTLSSENNFYALYFDGEDGTIHSTAITVYDKIAVRCVVYH